MSKGSISKKEKNPTPEKSIRKMRKKKKKKKKKKNILETQFLQLKDGFVQLRAFVSCTI
jgi:hypothetical protein